MLNWCLRIFFATVLITMLISTVTASLEQSMFSIPTAVWKNPWFIATLMDAYFGFLTFILWAWYRTPTLAGRLFWLVLILMLGNMAMAVYMLKLLFGLPISANAQDILLREDQKRSFAFKQD